MAEATAAFGALLQPIWAPSRPLSFHQFLYPSLRAGTQDLSHTKEEAVRWELFLMKFFTKDFYTQKNAL